MEDLRKDIRDLLEAGEDAIVAVYNDGTHKVFMMWEMKNPFNAWMTLRKDVYLVFRLTSTAYMHVQGYLNRKMQEITDAIADAKQEALNE